MKKYNNIINFLLQLKQKTFPFAVLLSYFLINVVFDADETMTNMLLWLGIYLYYYVFGNALRDGVMGLHNQFEIRYIDQINAFYSFLFVAPILIISMFLVYFFFNPNSQSIKFQAIQVFFTLVPLTMSTLYIFINDISRKISLVFLIIALNGTLTWLFFNNMKNVGDIMIFDIAGNNYSLHYIVVLLILVFYLLLVTFITSKIALKLYKPKLVGGIQ